MGVRTKGINDFRQETARSHPGQALPKIACLALEGQIAAIVERALYHLVSWVCGKLGNAGLRFVTLQTFSIGDTHRLRVQFHASGNALEELIFCRE